MSRDVTNASYGQPVEDLSVRKIEAVVLRARRFLDDQGTHRRSLDQPALAARRIDKLEIRMNALKMELNARFGDSVDMDFDSREDKKSGGKVSLQ